MAHDRRFYIRLIIIVGALLAAVVIAWLLITGIAKYFLVTHIVEEVTQNLSRRSGLSEYLVRGIVIIVSIPFFVAVVQFCKQVPLFWTGGIWTPRLWLYTKASGLVIVFYIGLYSLAIFWASRTTYSKKFCADTPEGIRAFDGSGPEPIYGIETHRCTLEEIEAIRKTEGASVGPKIIQIPDARHYAFYSPTGKPLVWYYKAPNGDYEFFDSSGIYPGTDDPLRPIDKQARNEIIAWQKAAALDRGKTVEKTTENSFATSDSSSIGAASISNAVTPNQGNFQSQPPKESDSDAQASVSTTPQVPVAITPGYQIPTSVLEARLGNLLVTISDCRRIADQISCLGTIENTGPSKQWVHFHTESKMVDNLANPNKGDLRIEIGSEGGATNLEPNLPLRFRAQGTGFQTAVSSVSISLTDAASNTSGIIRRIPVQ